MQSNLILVQRSERKAWNIDLNKYYYCIIYTMHKLIVDIYYEIAFVNNQSEAVF